MRIRAFLLGITLAVWIGCLLSAKAARAQLAFHIDLPTDTLNANAASGPFSLDFQLTDGSGTGDANNTAVLSNFLFVPGPNQSGSVAFSTDYPHSPLQRFEEFLHARTGFSRDSELGPQHDFIGQITLVLDPDRFRINHRRPIITLLISSRNPHHDVCPCDLVAGSLHPSAFDFIHRSLPQSGGVRNNDRHPCQLDRHLNHVTRCAGD